MNAVGVTLGVLFVIAASGLLYLTWLLFSRSFPRLSKSSVFTLWFLAFMMTTTLGIALTVVLRHG